MHHKEHCHHSRHEIALEDAERMPARGKVEGSMVGSAPLGLGLEKPSIQS